MYPPGGRGPSYFVDVEPMDVAAALADNAPPLLSNQRGG
jgi:hypothetical protein